MEAVRISLIYEILIILDWFFPILYRSSNILLKLLTSHIVTTVFSLCSRFNRTPKNHFHYQEWIIYTYGVSLQLPILNCVLDSCFCILAMKLLEWWKLFLFLTLFMILGGVHLKLKQHIDISNCYTNVITDISSG